MRSLKFWNATKTISGWRTTRPKAREDPWAVTPASTNIPDGEDMNVDNTINDNESYYEYEIDLKPRRNSPSVKVTSSIKP